MTTSHYGIRANAWKPSPTAGNDIYTAHQLSGGKNENPCCVCQPHGLDGRRGRDHWQDPRGERRAEAGWFPSMWLTDSRVRWEAVDENTALLFIPYEDQMETFVVRFDPQEAGESKQLPKLRRLRKLPAKEKGRLSIRATLAPRSVPRCRWADPAAATSRSDRQDLSRRKTYRSRSCPVPIPPSAECPPRKAASRRWTP